MVGFEVMPTTASSSIIRASLPLRSSSRDRKSIQTLWPSSESSCKRDLDICSSFLQFLDFAKPSHIHIPAVEARVQVGANEIDGQGRPDDLRAEAENVEVVMLDALMGGGDVVADRRTDSRQLRG